ncbi:protein kinase [Solirubrobacter ginsenosidimutans]|uniref:non-specific serine/threonine protein kinase n=1 Tax=Solirubrobacter ginsenosidimutans TaxID=490573 RepID=A0A9X3MQK3_9ACTN|nr:serine/threonine-protein kinase [Solirubrobacter ginsenosidimutans]MDA0160585.1 protein kinase [Solirubrobacter ginsenosidimutans]
MPRPGDRVGPYRLIEVAGEGGMGVVYRAADTLLNDRAVAVKVMAAHLSAEPAYRAAFLHEAQVAAEVSHPHVVPVHAAGESDGLLYLAMAWIDGRNLRELAAAGGLSAAHVVMLVRQIARALDAIHDAGIVHGDIKPSNILVHDSDHAYLLDFGVARRTRYADPRTNELVGGTPAYSAPEAVKGPFSDRYALGCVVFELLTGERPFGGGDAHLLARRHAQSPRPRVSDVVPELASFDVAVMRAMAINPAERFDSGAEFGRALEQADRAAVEPTTLVLLPRRREPTTPSEHETAIWTDDDGDATPGLTAPRREVGTRRAPTPAPPPAKTRLGVLTLVALLLAAAAVLVVTTQGGGGDDLATRQRAEDQKVITRLITHYGTALADGDLDLLARTVSPNVIRHGSDGVQGKCANDQGSKRALARWAAQFDELKGYKVAKPTIRIDGRSATVTAQSGVAESEPEPIRFTTHLDDGTWRITEVVAPPCS